MATKEIVKGHCGDSKCTYDVYTKEKTDELLNSKANTTDVYTKSKTDELLNTKANATSVYTKTETDNLLTKKQKTILSGTALPTTGENGDIFLLYEL